MQKTYPSDITRVEFEKIKPILESSRKKTHPRTLDLYDVFNGLLYVLKTGCQWSALPHDYPKYKTVHSYFMKWSEEKIVKRKKLPSMLEQVLKKISWRGASIPWSQRENKYGHR
jgi:transposase